MEGRAAADGSSAKGSAAAAGAPSGAAAAGAPSSSSSGGTASDGAFFPVLSGIMSCQRTRKAIDSAS